ncbi:hypothetical protein [Nocardiopsis sp. CC223A]|uniref:hypothetical protein n=1 Tax=Nocardiopsis sp. CC223A TaxID=3044051 RepID=UPI00278C0BD4|nr:hypothetical protein [Nocardiopsis sp. CC223A]
MAAGPIGPLPTTAGVWIRHPPRALRSIGPGLLGTMCADEDPYPVMNRSLFRILEPGAPVPVFVGTGLRMLLGAVLLLPAARVPGDRAPCADGDALPVAGVVAVGRAVRMYLTRDLL